ncbi:MAG: prepilin-type N-terminal cleavage/methylation domain-containing protein, partial [Proteobacteria bacterium]|nr:prepilin-type N-terminal cleavage/methylation domain-containing protein [Pseudomonadota bacterium]
MGNGFTPVELIAVLTIVGTLSAIAVVFFIRHMKSRKADEAIRIISSIIVSQEIEKAGKRLEYHEA